MRQNIFNTINSKGIDYSEEMQRIEKLFSREISLFSYEFKLSIEDYINRNGLFKGWKYRTTCLSTEDMREDLKITRLDIAEDDFATMINYFEFILNIGGYALSKCDYSIKDDLATQLSLIIENIKYILQRVSLVVEKIDDKYLIIENDINTTAVAEAYEDIAHDVIEYRKALIKGNLDLKRKILNKLAQKYEGIIPNLKSTEYKPIVSDLSSLLNNLHIRHNNLKGQKANEVVPNLSNERLEEWYDKTYDLMLTALLINGYLGYKNDIEKLNTELKSTKK